MPESIFHFRQFSINQDICAMKVGTDAVLLGSWADASNATTVLDIGTGTGVLTLMLAQKTNAKIDAIDIDENAYKQAKQNAELSIWKDRIHVFHSSLQAFSQSSDHKYSLIISNPPYFDENSASAIEARNITFHTHRLSFDELIEGVTKMLNQDGSFYVILPFIEGTQFSSLAHNSGLFLQKIMNVKTVKDKKIKRVLMKFGFEKRNLVEEELVIHEDDLSYTKDYIELTKDYYLGLNK